MIQERIEQENLDFRIIMFAISFYAIKHNH
jgi:hypothetical protein